MLGTVSLPGSMVCLCWPARSKLVVAVGGLGEGPWASLDLEWQERREAVFTEQRSLLAINGGRITGHCSMGSL